MCVRSSPGNTTVRGASAPLLGGAASSAVAVAAIVDKKDAKINNEWMSGRVAVDAVDAMDGRWMGDLLVQLSSHRNRISFISLPIDTYRTASM